MKAFLLLHLVLLSLAWGQAGPVKHPRVAEVEELLRDEASRYFERRFPGEAFFTRVEVTPLRRDAVSGKRTESLPYFDYESEEGVDEWDDPKTPLPFLRHRVSKVAIEISIPEKFSDERIAGLKEELSIYLRLLPYRDEIKIERKIKDKREFLVPDYAYVMIAGVFFASLIAALVIRSGLKKSALAGGAASAAAPMAQMPAASASGAGAAARQSSGKTSSSTAVSGDVTFHDAHEIDDWKVTIAETGPDSGTAGRLRKVAKYIEPGESFMLTYGDGVSDVDLIGLEAFHRAHGKMVTMTGVVPPGRFGELVLDGDTVADWAEKPTVSDRYINGGFMVIQRYFIDRFIADKDDEVMLEREPLAEATAAGELMLFRHGGFWQCMDTARDWSLLNELWESGNAPWAKG